ncbi:hypothetical protein Ocin01_14299 [Orchesella cincta]|uniref:C-type lectin domain-containing protein n=1 Tax=Orchesella cincta TaxID=48709 RepID=A0A1D2MHB1_ORCCI|nr:hypothetical protein Ocin01_14299 [Orchesella cincta]
MVAGNSFLLTSIIIILTLGLPKYGDAACPESNAKTGMKRLGNTRYFIHHESNHNKDKKMFLNWASAKTKCSETGFKMATIEDERTFAVVGRALEQIVVNEKLRDTWCMK